MEKTLRLFFTDRVNAWGQYTMRLKDEEVELFSPDFVSAFSYRLATAIAPSLTGAKVSKLAEFCLKMYHTEIKSAREIALSEMQEDPRPHSRLIRARRF